MDESSKAVQKTFDLILRARMIFTSQHQWLVTEVESTLDAMGLDRHRGILLLSHEWNMNINGLGIFVERNEFGSLPLLRRNTFRADCWASNGILFGGQGVEITNGPLRRYHSLGRVDVRCGPFRVFFILHIVVLQLFETGLLPFLISSRYPYRLKALSLGDCWFLSRRRYFHFSKQFTIRTSLAAGGTPGGTIVWGSLNFLKGRHCSIQ